MKKRIIAALLCAITVFTLFTGCGKKVECDFCGEEKKYTTKNVLGEEITICKDCVGELSDF